MRKTRLDRWRAILDTSLGSTLLRTLAHLSGMPLERAARLLARDPGLLLLLELAEQREAKRTEEAARHAVERYEQLRAEGFFK